jgi:hypothetical protein
MSQIPLADELICIAKNSAPFAGHDQGRARVRRARLLTTGFQHLVMRCSIGLRLASSAFAQMRRQTAAISRSVDRTDVINDGTANPALEFHSAQFNRTNDASLRRMNHDDNLMISDVNAGRVINDKNDARIRVGKILNLFRAR